MSVQLATIYSGAMLDSSLNLPVITDRKLHWHRWAKNCSGSGQDINYQFLEVPTRGTQRQPTNLRITLSGGCGSSIFVEYMYSADIVLAEEPLPHSPIDMVR